MFEKRGSFILSFFIGGLLGGGIALLLAPGLVRKRSDKPVRARRTRELRDEIEKQSYEEGIYCAPEGADMHYDIGKDMYYSNEG